MLAPLIAAATLAGSAPEWHARGIGVVNCRFWTLTRRAGAGAESLQGWVMGFISGRNAFSPFGGDAVGGLDGEAIWSQLDTACNATPDATLGVVVRQLVVDLDRAQAQHRPRQ